MKFIAIIEKAKDNYSAYLPDVPGCISTGSTLDEILQSIKDGLEFHSEGLIDDSLTLPFSVSLEKHLKKGDIILEDDVLIASISIPIPEKIK